MSNSKSAIKEIKNLMVQFGFMKADEVEMQSFKLEDNTILNAAKLEIGSKIYKIDDSFNQVAMEDGTFKLKENFEIEVAEGKILTVREIFLDAELSDGTAIKVAGDVLDKGAKVTVITADAEVPAPDGVHELKDGSKIETKDGVIVSVEDAPDETPAEEETEEAPEAPDVEAPQGMSAEMFDMLKEFISKMGDKMSQMEQTYSNLQNEFNAFKKEPGAKKLADGKTEVFSKSNNDEDALEARIAALKSLRK